MNSLQDARYRLRLADGFLGEARQDRDIARWRSCVDNSQIAVENAAKAVAALVGPVGRTHEAATLLHQALQAARFSSADIASVQRLAAIADQLGWSVHMASEYGDELAYKSPWDLFDEPAAASALALAEEAVTIARKLVAPPCQP